LNIDEDSSLVSDLYDLLQIEVPEEDIDSIAIPSIKEESFGTGLFENELNNRGKQYSDLLKHYVRISRIRNYLKEIVKIVFIVGISVSFGIVSYYEVKLLKYLCQLEESIRLVRLLPAFITAIAGYISAVIAVPLVITKYLFNSEEEKYIAEIVKHTQEHDLAGRKILKDTTFADKKEK
jgi:hypothetical protein